MKELMNKEEIRKQIKEQKSKLPKEWILENSKIISNKLLEMDIYKETKCIYTYLNFNQEVITEEIITDALSKGKKVAIPKITNNTIEFYYIKSINNVAVSTKGIREPTSTQIAKEQNPLIIIPGIAFDKQKHRIGYGGGFYDKYLEKNNPKTKIALSFDFQILNEIPNEKHDIMLNIIITEKQIII